MVYPKPYLAQRIIDEPGLVRLIWQGLQKISAEDLRSEGRIYGDDIQKIEPREIRGDRSLL